MTYEPEATEPSDLEGWEHITRDRNGQPLLSPEQELRMRCVEAAARSVSGAQYPVDGNYIRSIADVLERYVKGG